MNADAIDQLLDVIRDCIPLLEQLRDNVRAGSSLGDIERNIEHAHGVVARLADRLDAFNLQAARQRALTRNGVAARLQVEHGGSVEPAPLLACSPSDANGRTKGRAGGE